MGNKQKKHDLDPVSKKIAAEPPRMKFLKN